MSGEKFYEDVRRILENLVADSSEDVVVLVEGMRDEEALRMIGLRGKIIHVSKVEKTLMYMPKPRKIILLLDFDEEGINGVKKMSRLLTIRGYRVDTTYHRKLRMLKRVGITTVEGIKKLFQT